MPVELPVSACAEATTSTLSVARSGRGNRPSAAVVRSRSRPLRVALRMSATQSTKVDAPGSRQLNAIVDTHSMVGPSRRPVMSTAMS